MVDDNNLSSGSFNWFSASRTPEYANMETSMVYSGDLKKELQFQIKFFNANKWYQGKKE